MRFFQFVYKNVLRRKVRSTLTAIGIAVAITAVVALLGVADGFVASSKEMLTGVDLVVIQKGLGERNTGRMDEGIGRLLSEIPQVAQVTPLLNDTVKMGDDVPIPFRGYPPGSPPLASLQIAAGNGRTLQAGDSDGVLLGKFLAKNLGKKVGDTVNIETKDFKVLGIYDAPSTMENRGAAAMLSELQTLMDRPKQVSEFDLSFKPEFSGDQGALERVQAAVSELHSPGGKRYGLEALTTEQFVSSSNEIRLAQAMAWMTSTIALVIGAVGMLNTMIMSVLERTQEIGILRAIGWRKRRIMRMILGESFALTLTGALAGIVGAVLLTKLVSHVPLAEGLVRPDVSPQVIVIGFLLALLVGFVGGAYPAFRGASLAPTEALRYE